MGKTRNLRRSKKVVKTKRTRSRVSKKNGKKTHKKRYNSRKKRGGDLLSCNLQFKFGGVDNAIRCEREKIAKLEEKMLLQKSNIDYQKTIMGEIINKRTALHKFLKAKKTKLEADLEKANGTLVLYYGQINPMTEQLNDKITKLKAEITKLKAEITKLKAEIQRDYKAQIEYDIKVLTEELNAVKTQESGHGLNADSTYNSFNLDKQLKTKKFILDFLNENPVKENPVKVNPDKVNPDKVNPDKVNDNEDNFFPLIGNENKNIEMTTLTHPHSAEVYAVLRKNGLFKKDDDEYNNLLLTKVSEDETVKNAKNLESAIIDAAKKIANEKANFPDKPPEPTINDAINVESDLI